ncbi:TRAM domain-containing protein [Haloarchaeobius amylolyticus]|uniref:TRAM domain-containing protein n=1 Tax=Haloarchaeobius amylolyticus TaxID=1198296 RepID=UPI00226F3E0A|nr:TRAM domain-containing protein [Haloarchaeobius amylolyticus]
MTEIPDSLQALFSARIQSCDDSYVLEIPSNEIDAGSLDPGETYRVALLESDTPSTTTTEATQTDTSPASARDEPTRPPVDEGEVRDLTIETIGQKGDGIAKVERGYVIIVPNTKPGDEPRVRIKKVRENVAFAKVLD